MARKLAKCTEGIGRPNPKVVFPSMFLNITVLSKIAIMMMYIICIYPQTCDYLFLKRIHLILIYILPTTISTFYVAQSYAYKEMNNLFI